MIMKKTVILTLMGLLMLAFATAMVSAGPTPGRMCPFGNQPNLTDTQKEEMAPLVTEMNDLHAKMFEVHKAMIQKQVGFGNMTQAEADQCIVMMQEHKGPGNVPAMMGKGHNMERGHGMGHGHDMMNGCPMNQVEPADNK